MEKQDLITQLGLLAIMVVMILSTYMPKPWDMVAVFGTYFLVVAYIILSEKILQYVLAAWPALDAVVISSNSEPSLQRITFLVSSRESITRSENTYLTLVKLAYPYKDAEGGKTREILIYHLGEWQNRLAFRPGRIRWSGLSLNHPMVEHVILGRDPRGYVSRAKLYPVFHIIATGHDAEKYMSQYIRGFAVGRR